MNDLVVLKGKEVFTDSLVIADGTGIAHRYIKEQIRKHRSKMERFGLLVAYTTESTGGRPEEIYQLKEEQASFLITLLKNTDKVVDFKLELIRQFYAMRQFIQEQQSSEWKFFRQQGKTVRLAETDVLKELAEYAKSQGSINHNKIYSNYTRLANKTVGIKSVKDATIMQLSYLMLVENIFIQVIRSGMVMNKDYHDIYKDCKEKVIQLGNAVEMGVTATA